MVEDMNAKLGEQPGLMMVIIAALVRRLGGEVFISLEEVDDLDKVMLVGERKRGNGLALRTLPISEVGQA